jgi:hypothetical protein
VFAVSISIDRACAGDGNVLFFKRVDEWRIIHQLDAFPPGKHQWVFARVTREAEGCSGANMEIHVALQADRTRYEFAGGNNNPAPFRRMAETAFWKASVQSVLLSPTAPNFMTLKSRSGNTGALIRARIAGSSDHASAGAGAYSARPGHKERGAMADSRRGPPSTPLDTAIPTAPMPLINSRRLVPVFFIVSVIPILFVPGLFAYIIL